MRKEELMVGNMVKLSLLDRSLEQEISLNAKQLIGLRRGDFLWKPVPISVDVLKHLGFEDDIPSEEYDSDIEYVRDFGRKKIIVRQEAGGWVLLQRFDIGLNYTKVAEGLKYVHQIQNLTKLLTDERK